MWKHIFIIAMSTSSCSQQIDQERNIRSSNIYVYNSSSDNRAMVFDFDRMIYWTQDKNDLPDSSAGGDIGSGSIERCSVKNNKCIKSPFYFSATKEKDNSCKFHVEKNGINNIECKNSIDIKFSFSENRGLIYFSWEEHGDLIKWECASKKCIFEDSIN